MSGKRFVYTHKRTYAEQGILFILWQRRSFVQRQSMEQTDSHCAYVSGIQFTITIYMYITTAVVVN